MDKHVGTELKAAIGDLQTLAARLLDDGRAWWNNRREDMGRYEYERDEQRYQSHGDERSRAWREQRGSEGWREDDMRDEAGFRSAGGASQGRRAPFGPQPGREQDNTRGYPGYAERASSSGAGARYAREQYQDDESDARSGNAEQGMYGRQMGRGAYEYGTSGYSQGRQGYGRDPDQNLGQSGYGQPGLGQGGYGQYGSRQDDQRGYGQPYGEVGTRGQGQFRGRGPKGYSRSDERMTEDLNERLTDDALLDASEISVEVKDGVATLQGTVDSRWMKHRAEDIADACSGIRDVRNEIRVSGSQRSAGAGTQPRSTERTREHGKTAASDDDTQTGTPH